MVAARLLEAHSRSNIESMAARGATWIHSKKARFFNLAFFYFGKTVEIKEAVA